MVTPSSVEEESSEEDSSEEENSVVRTFLGFIREAKEQEEKSDESLLRDMKFNDSSMNFYLVEQQLLLFFIKFTVFVQ